MVKWQQQLVREQMVPPAPSDVLSHSPLYPTKNGWKAEASVGAGVGCEGVKNRR